jgi:hypothetical protein
MPTDFVRRQSRWWVCISTTLWNADGLYPSVYVGEYDISLYVICQWIYVVCKSVGVCF